MDVTELMQRALGLQGSGNFGEAEVVYRQVINLVPRYDDAHHMLASVYQRTGKIDLAIASVNLAIDISPRRPIFFNFLGVCYLIRKESIAAELCFRHAIELQSDYADAYNNLGLALLNKKHFSDARPVLEQALQLAPSDVNTLCNLGRVYQELDRVDQALSLYEQALALQPDNVNAQLGKVACLQKLSRYADALAIVDALPTLPPAKKAEALRTKAVLLNITGRIEEACSTFDLALAEAPDSVELAHSRSQLRKIRRDEPFFQHLQKLESRLDAVSGRSKAQLCYALGKAYQDTGDIAKAAKYYAEGGSSRLQTEEYDEKNDITLFAAIERNASTHYIRGLTGGSASARPIFILGMERSGTTLVEQILASHPDVFPGGELNFLAEVLTGYRLPDGVQFKSSGLESFDPQTPLNVRAERYLQKIDTLPGSIGYSRITDKMPGNFKNLGFIRALFPNARIIHCRRDPVDNCISSYTTLFANGTQWSFDLAAMGRRYRAYWQMMAHWRRELPGEFLELRYEQVVEDTEGAARRLLDWCGLPWDDRVMRFYETNRPVQTASSTQVRQPIYKSSMGRWKQWEQYIAPLLNEIGEIERAYWRELEN